jgi:hypothetical protein
VTCAVRIGHVLNTDLGPLRLESSKMKDKEEAVVVVETDSVETQEGRVDARCRFDCKVRQQSCCTVKTVMPASRFYIEINGWLSLLLVQLFDKSTNKYKTIVEYIRSCKGRSQEK